MHIILASGSPYRKSLLRRLGLPFRCVSPDVEEKQRPNEQPEQMAARLARSKAEAIAALYPANLVIGSDQVASIDGSIMGKPGNHAVARQQLLASSGRVVTFYTGVSLRCREGEIALCKVERFDVLFRPLSDGEIENYLHREQPFDCAGSFKCEGLGIALFKEMRGNDPTSLEGLPLIALCELMRQAGVEVLGDAANLA